MCQISKESTQLLINKGLLYDRSALHRDCEAYYLRVGDTWEKVDPSKPAATWMKPLVRGATTDLVEIRMCSYTYALQPANETENLIVLSTSDNLVSHELVPRRLDPSRLHPGDAQLREHRGARSGRF